MCDHGDIVPIKVKVLAEQSHNGRNTWKTKPIDRCIAPLVAALQAGGIDMRGSCCGHGEGNGEILLGDGRRLKVIDNRDHAEEALKALVGAVGHPRFGIEVRRGRSYPRLPENAHNDGSGA